MGSSGAGGFGDVGSLISSLGLDSGGGTATGASAIPQDMIDWANAQSPMGAITPGNPLGSGPIVPGTATSGPGPLSAVGDFWDANKGWIKDAAGLGLAGAGIGKGLLQQAAVPDSRAGQQQLLQELQQLRGTLNPNASQSSAKLQQLIDQATTLGNQLMSGELTAQQSALVKNNLGSTLSLIRSRYGSLGMGHSTAEMQDEAAAQSTSMAGEGNLQTANRQQGITLLQAASSGNQAAIEQALRAAGLSGPVLSGVAAQQATEDAALSQAIARLAAATMAT